MRCVDFSTGSSLENEDKVVKRSDESKLIEAESRRSE